MQYRTIPSGIPLESFKNRCSVKAQSFRKAIGVANDSLLFVSSGRLVTIKGFDLLIKAFAISEAGRSGAHLALVGDGPERKNLEKLATELGVSDKVVFTGFHTDIIPALSAADVFVLASRNEGMGRSIVEAMVAGCAVIATDAGGIPTFLNHEQNGLLVPRGNIDALSEALDRLATNPAIRKKLATQAAKSLSSEFDEHTMASRLADLYADVLNLKVTP